jgi:hypothetical protein
LPDSSFNIVAIGVDQVRGIVSVPAVLGRAVVPATVFDASAGAAQAFAVVWDDGELHYKILLRIHPVNSPSDAVRAVFASRQEQGGLMMPSA